MSRNGDAADYFKKQLLADDELRTSYLNDALFHATVELAGTILEIVYDETDIASFKRIVSTLVLKFTVNGEEKRRMLLTAQQGPRLFDPPLPG